MTDIPEAAPMTAPSREAMLAEAARRVMGYALTDKPVDWAGALTQLQAALDAPAGVGERPCPRCGRTPCVSADCTARVEAARDWLDGLRDPAASGGRPAGSEYRACPNDKATAAATADPPQAHIPSQPV